MNLKTLQSELAAWTKHNFGEPPAINAFLGIVEEAGELAHATLKKRQGIRTNEDHDENARDAVADIAIFLVNFCILQGWDFEDILFSTWEDVKKRDWKRYPENGISDPVPEVKMKLSELEEIVNDSCGHCRKMRCPVCRIYDEFGGEQCSQQS